jgi:hypothetical protein
MVADASAVVGWFQNERGITSETLAAFGVGVRPDGAVVIPYARGAKIRKGIPHGERQFFFEGEVTLFNEAQAVMPVVILVEGETDTMRLYQELATSSIDLGPVGVVGLPGIETWNVPGTQDVRPVILQALQNAEQVYMVFDNDKDYMVQGRVDGAAKALKRALPRGVAHRVRLPSDVKDVCEFFGRYDLETFKTLLSSPQQGGSRFKTLDLAGTPPPVRWLVQDLLCRGDIHLELGEPGIGKSWLTMDLSVAVLQGRPWLNKPVVEGPGRVLYFDEENPEDLIFDRLFRLGMTLGDVPNLRYINNQGLRLDRHADDMIEEALDFEPSLIVLDSLTRFHTGDEDKAGFMAALYNDALKPLARESQAAVVVLHHANKSDANSSYRRSRGSGEIIANADCGYDVRVAGVNAVTMAKFKSRRGMAGEVLNIAITDTAEGGVRVVGGASLPPAF